MVSRYWDGNKLIIENWEYLEVVGEWEDKQGHKHIETRVAGEIDRMEVLYDKKEIRIYELKSSDNERTRYKAKTQLQRAYDYLWHCRESGWRIKTYFESGETVDKVKVKREKHIPSHQEFYRRAKGEFYGS